MRHRRQLFVLLCLISMEVFAAFAMLEGVSLIESNALRAGIIWTLLVTGWVGVMVSTIVTALGAGESTSRISLLIGGLVVSMGLPLLLLHSVTSALLPAFLLGIVYWRSITIARDRPEYSDVQRRFGFGLALVLFGIVLLVARGVEDGSSVWRLVAVTSITFTIISLAALGAARVEDSGQRGAGGAVILSISAPLLALLVLSVAALSILSLDVSGWLGGLLSPAWDLFTHFIASTFGLLLSPAFWVVEHIRASLHATSHAPPNPGAPRRPGTMKATKGPAAGHEWFPLVGTLFLLLAAGFLVMLIWRATPRGERDERRDASWEERRSRLSPGAVVRRLFTWLRGRFSGGARAAGRAVEEARRRVIGPAYPTDPIRRIYAQVLYRAARQGLTRSASTTPAEFQASLQGRWPRGDADFAAVTGAYMRRRYGDTIPDAAEIRQVREHWRSLRDLMRGETPDNSRPSSSDSLTNRKA